MQDQLTPRILLWAGACVATLGMAMLVWSFRSIHSRHRRQRGGQHTTGVVVENRITTDMENSTLVHPIVEFTTASGRTLRVECSWSTQVRHAVGSQVPVYYDPDRPEEAGIVGEGRLGPLLLTVFAAGVVVFGLLLLAAGALGFPPSH